MKTQAPKKNTTAYTQQELEFRLTMAKQALSAANASGVPHRRKHAMKAINRIRCQLWAKQAAFAA